MLQTPAVSDDPVISTPERPNSFSVRSQRALLYWGIAFGIIYGIAFGVLLQQVPTKNPAWTPEQVADWYVHHQGQILWGAVVASWTACFMVPIITVVAVQIGRVETGGLKVWTPLALVSGALMTVVMALPPVMWGAAAYTAPRKDPEVTTLMHELATLTQMTTDQFYIFMWVAVTVISLRPATQLVKNNPFPRWWGYTSLWITLTIEVDALAFITRRGPLAWNGLLVFWVTLFLFFVWLTIQIRLIFRALRAQEAD